MYWFSCQHPPASIVLDGWKELPCDVGFELGNSVRPPLL